MAVILVTTEALIFILHNYDQHSMLMMRLCTCDHLQDSEFPLNFNHKIEFERVIYKKTDSV